MHPDLKAARAAALAEVRVKIEEKLRARAAMRKVLLEMLESVRALQDSQ
jgi:hypothetical protein